MFVQNLKLPPLLEVGHVQPIMLSTPFRAQLYTIVLRFGGNWRAVMAAGSGYYKAIPTGIAEKNSKELGMKVYL